MQKIVICSSDATTASATTFKNALQSYASDYFDSFDVVTNASNETLVRCKVGDTVALSFVYDSSTNPKELIRTQDNAVKWTSNNLCVYNMYVFQSAIVLEYGYLNYYFEPYTGIYVIICKRTDGKTAIVYASHHNKGNLEFDMSNWANDGYCVISIDGETGASTIGESPKYCIWDTSRVAGFNPFSIVDGVAVSNVYAQDRTGFSSGYNREYDSTYNTYVYKPFQYEVNGENYTGFFQNYFSIKGA